MTALKELVQKIMRTGKLSHNGKNIIFDETYNQEEVIEKLNQEYSVTFRNTSESAVNAKSEQSITDEELATKIEDMMNNVYICCDCKYADNEENLNGKEYVIEELINLFKNHLNSASNNSVEHSINQEQMLVHIQFLAVEFAEKAASPKALSIRDAFKVFQQELRDCFKQHFKTSKSSDGQTLMKDNSVFQNSIKNSIRSKIGEIVNSSDDLSIIVEKLTEYHMASIEPVFRALDE